MEVYIKRRNEKREKWTMEKPVLEIDKTNAIIKVQGNSGKVISAAVEDICLAGDNNSSSLIQTTID